jgi:hypothetical protein
MRASSRSVLLVCLAFSICTAGLALVLTLAGFGTAHGDMPVAPSSAALPMLLAVAVLALRHHHSPHRAARPAEVTRHLAPNRT